MNIGQWYFEFKNVEEFFPLLWERVAPHLVRGVIITDNQGAISCTWMEGPPGMNQLHLFAAIFDVGLKEFVPWERVNAAKLRAIQTVAKEFKVYVYKYSKNVVSKNNFELVERTLINASSTDRAGAATLTEEERLSDELIAIHGQSIKGTSHLSWRMWANYILSKPAAMRDELLQSGPLSAIWSFLYTY